MELSSWCREPPLTPLNRAKPLEWQNRSSLRQVLEKSGSTDFLIPRLMTVDFLKI